MYQLIYTSAPRLLEAGKTGFGTLARSKEMPLPLVSYIERLSTFDRAAGINSLCFYSLFRQGALQYHVFSHVAEAGADYTGRTNHLAEHYAVEAGSTEERGLMGSTPAGAMLALAPLWHRTYTGGPSYLGEPALPSAGATSDTGSWQQAAGGGDCARWLAQPNYKDGACLRFDEVMDEGQALKLLHDAFLHMRNHGWGVGFSTATVSNLSAKVVPFTVLDARQAAAGVTCPRGCPELKITHGMQAPPKETAPAPAAPAAARQPLPRGSEPKVYHGSIPSLPTVSPPGGTPPPPSAPPALNAASMPPPPVNDEDLTYFGGGARASKPGSEQEGKGIPMPVVVGGSILIGALLAFALLKNGSPETPPAPKPNTEQTPATEPKNEQPGTPAGQTRGQNTDAHMQEPPQNPTTEVDISDQRNKVETAKKEFENCKVEFDKLGDLLPNDHKDEMQKAQRMLDAAGKDIDAAPDSQEPAKAADAAANKAEQGVGKAKNALARAREYVERNTRPSAGKGEKPAEGDNDFCSADNQEASQPQAGEQAKGQPTPKPVRHVEDEFAKGTTHDSPQSSGQFTSTNPEFTIPEGSTHRVAVKKDSVEVTHHEDKGANEALELDIKATILWDQLPKEWREQFSDNIGGLVKVEPKNEDADEIRDGGSYHYNAHITYIDKQLSDLYENKNRLLSSLPKEIEKHCKDKDLWKSAKKGKEELHREAKNEIEKTEKKVEDFRVNRLPKSHFKELKEPDPEKNRLNKSLITLEGKLKKLAPAPNDSWKNTLDVVNNILHRLDECLEKPTPKQRIKEIVEQKLFMKDNFDVTFTVKRVEGPCLHLEIKDTYKQP